MNDDVEAAAHVLMRIKSNKSMKSVKLMDPIEQIHSSWSRLCGTKRTRSMQHCKEEEKKAKKAKRQLIETIDNIVGDKAFSKAYYCLKELKPKESRTLNCNDIINYVQKNMEVDIPPDKLNFIKWNVLKEYWEKTKNHWYQKLYE